jgi:hypothetical protein
MLTVVSRFESSVEVAGAALSSTASRDEVLILLTQGA